MATEELYSTAITAMRAGGVADKRIHGGIVKVALATFETGAFDAGSIYRCARLPAHARLSHLGISFDDHTGGPIDIGVYPADSDTALDADCYATDIDIDTAASAVGSNGNNKWEALNVDKVEQKIWQDAGVATEPIRGTLYDICITTSTAITGGGTISMRVEYVDGD